MFDMVHDVGFAYRKLVKANSYPGDVVSIAKYSKKNSININFFDHTLLMAYMLLDAEVTFHVVGHDSNMSANMIGRLTYARHVELEEADFIFVLNSASDEAVLEAIKRAKIGNLIDPHLSATIIMEADSVTGGENFSLYGPGIETSKDIRLNMPYEWEIARGEKNCEYPLGIEMYLIDAAGDMIALPRTTRIEGWDN